MANQNPKKAAESSEGSKILAEPLPQILAEIDENVRKAADAAVKAAVQDATKKIEESKKAIEEVSKKADEALTRASDALPAEVVKKVLRSWQFTGILILFFLAAVFASIAISVAISVSAR